MTRRDLFGRRPLNVGRYLVYHDESGTDVEHQRYQLHGAMFVPRGKWRDLAAKLSEARQGYSGRIHFKELRDNARSSKADVARRWLTLYARELASDCFYKCMVDDPGDGTSVSQRQTPEKPFYRYNHTAQLAMWSGIKWSLAEYEKVELEIYSEELSRTAEDNFRTYVPRELMSKGLDHNGRANPVVEVDPRYVTLIPGSPEGLTGVNKIHSDFIQLVDLITASVGQAINADATRKIKVDLAKLVAQWVQDTRLPPWLQTQELHRRFSVSCFAGGENGFVDVELKIVNRDQPTLL